MKITVLSDPIVLGDVIDGLRDGGIVVLATMRTHADEISTQVDQWLDEQESNYISAILSSVEESGEGWTEFLYCPENIELDMAEIKIAVLKALQQWRNGGSPGQFEISC